MTWTKLSDDFGDECWTLSDSAFRLLVEMLTYSNRKLLNCMIPKDEFRRFAKHPEALEELLAGGWCHEDGGTVEIIYHATYQRERDVQLAIQKRNVENGAKGGRPRKPKPLPPNPDGNPAGFDNPDGKPDGNPKGRAGTGRTSAHVQSETESLNVDPQTGEILPADGPHVEELRLPGNKVRLVEVAS